MQQQGQHPIAGLLRHDEQLGHSQQMLSQQLLFSSQDQLHQVQEISEEFMMSAPSDQQQMSTNQMETQSDQRLYHEHCPKHGGPSRSPESNLEELTLATRPGEMVVKESSGKFVHVKEVQLIRTYTILMRDGINILI